jgi:hypothetical protein
MKPYVIHFIVYTFLSTLLALSVTLNWFFVNGRIRMDTEKILKSKEIEELYGDMDSPKGNKK